MACVVLYGSGVDIGACPGPSIGIKSVRRGCRWCRIHAAPLLSVVLFCIQEPPLVLMNVALVFCALDCVADVFSYVTLILIGACSCCSSTVGTLLTVALVWVWSFCGCGTCRLAVALVALST